MTATTDSSGAGSRLQYSYEASEEDRAELALGSDSYDEFTVDLESGQFRATVDGEAVADFPLTRVDAYTASTETHSTSREAPEWLRYGLWAVGLVLSLAVGVFVFNAPPVRLLVALAVGTLGFLLGNVVGGVIAVSLVSLWLGGPLLSYLPAVGIGIVVLLLADVTVDDLAERYDLGVPGTSTEYQKWVFVLDREGVPDGVVYGTHPILEPDGFGDVYLKVPAAGAPDPDDLWEAVGVRTTGPDRVEADYAEGEAVAYKDGQVVDSRNFEGFNESSSSAAAGGGGHTGWGYYECGNCGEKLDGHFDIRRSGRDYECGNCGHRLDRDGARKARREAEDAWDEEL